jgi:hypothetical protein
MTRLVRAADGRMWTVRSRLEWTDPVVEEEFETDVSGGRTGAVFLLITLMGLFVALVANIPSRDIVPGWLLLAFLLLVLFFPMRWMVRRPWTLVAETFGGGNELPAERWVGSVRGFFTARSETSRAARHLREYAIPDRDGDGPLQPVN